LHLTIYMYKHKFEFCNADVCSESHEAVSRCGMAVGA